MILSKAYIRVCMFWARVTSRTEPITSNTQHRQLSSAELVRMECTVEVTRYVTEFCMQRMKFAQFKATVLCQDSCNIPG